MNDPQQPESSEPDSGPRQEPASEPAPPVTEGPADEPTRSTAEPSVTGESGLPAPPASTASSSPPAPPVAPESHATPEPPAAAKVEPVQAPPPTAQSSDGRPGAGRFGERRDAGADEPAEASDEGTSLLPLRLFPAGWRRNLLIGGTAAATVVIGLSELTSAWVVLVLPLLVAAMVAYVELLDRVLYPDDFDEIWPDDVDESDGFDGFDGDSAGGGTHTAAPTRPGG
jgi:hypothetical protein